MIALKKKTGFLLVDNQGNGVIAESMAALKKAGFEEEECTVFVNKILGLLDDSRDLRPLPCRRNMWAYLPSIRC